MPSKSMMGEICCEICGWEYAPSWLVPCKNSDRCGQGRHFFCMDSVKVPSTPPADLASFPSLECAVCFSTSAEGLSGKKRTAAAAAASGSKRAAQRGSKAAPGPAAGTQAAPPKQAAAAAAAAPDQRPVETATCAEPYGHGNALGQAESVFAQSKAQQHLVVGADGSAFFGSTGGDVGRDDLGRSQSASGQLEQVASGTCLVGSGSLRECNSAAAAAAAAAATGQRPRMPSFDFSFADMEPFRSAGSGAASGADLIIAQGSAGSAGQQAAAAAAAAATRAAAEACANDDDDRPLKRVKPQPGTKTTEAQAALASNSRPTAPAHDLEPQQLEPHQQLERQQQQGATGKAAFAAVGKDPRAPAATRPAAAGTGTVPVAGAAAHGEGLRACKPGSLIDKYKGQLKNHGRCTQLTDRPPPDALQRGRRKPAAATGAAVTAAAAGVHLPPAAATGRAAVAAEKPSLDPICSAFDDLNSPAVKGAFAGPSSRLKATGKPAGNPVLTSGAIAGAAAGTTAGGKPAQLPFLGSSRPPLPPVSSGGNGTSHVVAGRAASGFGGGGPSVAGAVPGGTNGFGGRVPNRTVGGFRAAGGVVPAARTRTPTFDIIKALGASGSIKSSGSVGAGPSASSSLAGADSHTGGMEPLNSQSTVDAALLAGANNAAEDHDNNEWWRKDSQGRRVKLWECVVPLSFNTAPLQKGAPKGLLHVMEAISPHESMVRLCNELQSSSKRPGFCNWRLMQGGDVPATIKDTRDFYLENVPCETCLVMYPKKLLGDVYDIFMDLVGKLKGTDRFLAVELPLVTPAQLAHDPVLARLLHAQPPNGGGGGGGGGGTGDSRTVPGGPYRLYFVPHQVPIDGVNFDNGIMEALLCLTGSRKHVHLMSTWEPTPAAERGVKGIIQLMKKNPAAKQKVIFDYLDKNKHLEARLMREKEGHALREKPTKDPTLVAGRADAAGEAGEVAGEVDREPGDTGASAGDASKVATGDTSKAAGDISKAAGDASKAAAASDASKAAAGDASKAAADASKAAADTSKAAGDASKAAGDIDQTAAIIGRQADAALMAAGSSAALVSSDWLAVTTVTTAEPACGQATAMGPCLRASHTAIAISSGVQDGGDTAPAVAGAEVVDTPPPPSDVDMDISPQVQLRSGTAYHRCEAAVAAVEVSHTASPSVVAAASQGSAWQHQAAGLSVPVEQQTSARPAVEAQMAEGDLISTSTVLLVAGQAPVVMQPETTAEPEVPAMEARVTVPGSAPAIAAAPVALSGMAPVSHTQPAAVSDPLATAFTSCGTYTSAAAAVNSWDIDMHTVDAPSESAFSLEFTWSVVAAGMVAEGQACAADSSDVGLAITAGLGSSVDKSNSDLMELHPTSDHKVSAAGAILQRSGSTTSSPEGSIFNPDFRVGSPQVPAGKGDWQEDGEELLPTAASNHPVEDSDQQRQHQYGMQGQHYFSQQKHVYQQEHARQVVKMKEEDAGQQLQPWPLAVLVPVVEEDVPMEIDSPGGGSGAVSRHAGENSQDEGSESSAATALTGLGESPAEEKGAAAGETCGPDGTTGQVLLDWRTLVPYTACSMLGCMAAGVPEQARTQLPCGKLGSWRDLVPYDPCIDPAAKGPCVPLQHQQALVQHHSILPQLAQEQAEPVAVATALHGSIALEHRPSAASTDAPSGGASAAADVSGPAVCTWSWAKPSMPVLQAPSLKQLGMPCKELLCQLPQLMSDLQRVSCMPLRGCQLRLAAKGTEAVGLEAALDKAAQELGFSWASWSLDAAPDSLDGIQFLLLSDSVVKDVSYNKALIIKSIAVHPIQLYRAEPLVSGLQRLAQKMKDLQDGGLPHGPTLEAALHLAHSEGGAVAKDCQPLYPLRVVVVLDAQGFLKTPKQLLKRLTGCLLAGSRAWGEPWQLQMRAADIAVVQQKGSPEHQAVLASALDPAAAAAAAAEGGDSGGGALPKAEGPAPPPVLVPLDAAAESSSKEMVVFKDATRLMHVARPGRLVMAAYADDEDKDYSKKGRKSKNILAGTVTEVVCFLDLLLKNSWQEGRLGQEGGFGGRVVG